MSIWRFCAHHESLRIAGPGPKPARTKFCEDLWYGRPQSVLLGPATGGSVFLRFCCPPCPLGSLPIGRRMRQRKRSSMPQALELRRRPRLLFVVWWSKLYDHYSRVEVFDGAPRCSFLKS
jgi:hypothetical protein